MNKSFVTMSQLRLRRGVLNALLHKIKTTLWIRNKLIALRNNVQHNIENYDTNDKYDYMDLSELFKQLRIADEFVTICSIPELNYSIPELHDKFKWQVETNEGDAHAAETLEGAIRQALRAYDIEEIDLPDGNTSEYKLRVRDTDNE